MPGTPVPNTASQPVPHEDLSQAQSGGNGSFDFADTSRYGPRQLRSATPGTGRLIVPGVGGGAKPTPTAHYGGRGSNGHPEGIVIVRLLKIT